MTTAEGWNYRVNIADILLDTDVGIPERSRRVAERLRSSRWVQDLPDHEPIHQHLRDLESNDSATIFTAMNAVYDEAAYHRVHIETTLVIPNPESL